MKELRVTELEEQKMHKKTSVMLKMLLAMQDLGGITESKKT